MGIDYASGYSVLIGWLFGLAILITAAWFIVYYASRTATREVMGQISNVEVSVTPDGRTLRLRNTGALALVNITVDRHPPQSGSAGHLWSIATLATGAAATADVPPTTPELPANVLVSWRVGSPSGPLFTVVRPLVREG